MQGLETIHHHPFFQLHCGVHFPILPIFRPPGPSNHSPDVAWVFVQIWDFAQAVITTLESLSLSSTGFRGSWFIQQIFQNLPWADPFQTHGISSEQNSPSLHSWSKFQKTELQSINLRHGLKMSVSIVNKAFTKSLLTYDRGGFFMSS